MYDVCVCDVGESGLHLAIVNNDEEMVKRLVTCGAHVNQRASGRFFIPEDQKQLRNGVTNYSGLFGYVQIPLGGPDQTLSETRDVYSGRVWSGLVRSVEWNLAFTLPV